MTTPPTKGNLMAARRSIALARTGYDLMDRKRNILTRELMALIDRAAGLQKRIDGTFAMAYASLQAANITLGIVSDVAGEVPEDDGLTLRYRSVMGVELPTVHYEERPFRPQYGFFETNSALDDAYMRFTQVKKLVRELAEVEISIYRLAVAVKKTRKRANALDNIVIPRLKKTISEISDALEEREREEFARLKVLKARAQ